MVSPTHAEAARITDAIRAGLKSKGTIHDEHVINSWVPAHLTDAEKTDATQYAAGELIQFQQNAPGFNKGSRVTVAGGAKLPLQQADRFEVFRPQPLALSKGDRIRITAGGKTKDGKHRLNNGALLTVHGFTKQGDIIVDHDWVIGGDFGHLTHGYVVTSHISQGVTVDKVFVGISSQSLPATDERTAYVAVTRGREKVEIFTDDKEELLSAMTRQDDPMSATELTRSNRSKKRGLGRGHNVNKADMQIAARGNTQSRELDHER